MGLNIERIAGEIIHLGENIVVRVLSVRGKRVKLGIEAPRSTTILRGELRDRDLTKPHKAG